MKLLTVFGLIYLFDVSKAFQSESKNYSQLPSAVFEAIHGINIKLNFTANFLTSDLVESFQSKDFIDELLAKTFDDKTVICHHESTLKNKKSTKLQRQLTIVIIEKFVDFLDIQRKFVQFSFKFNGNFLIVLTNRQIKEVQEMFRILWKLQIFNVNVMFEGENKEVLVQTFMPFNAQNCNDTTPVLINIFKDGTFVNGTLNFFPQKIKNLHNCPVRVAISTDQKPYVIQNKFPNGSYSLNGGDIDLINVLSSSLNFRINLTYIGEQGYFLSNGTAVGPLKALLDGNADFSVAGWFLKFDRLKFLDSTSSYFEDHIIFMTPPGHELSALERLVHPFQFALWMMILICFFVGVSVIFVIRRRSKVVQDFVFGTDVKTPYLNLFIAFIGGMQKKLPGRNFARFLLMMFLMYSLIIRTLYQASYYEILKSNKKHKELQTIDEAIEKNYKFYARFGTEDLYQGLDALKNK
jgi:Ligated ion channel L-glutamate- and glycine-binding site